MSMKHALSSDGQAPSADVISRSLEYILSSNLSHQEYSLRVLINCTLDEKSRHAIYQKIGEQAFVNLLQSDSEVVQMLAAWLLSHFTLDDDLCTAIIRSSMVEHLLSLLYSENADVQEKVLWACNNILFNDSTGKFASQFEVIGKLTALLNSSPPSIIRTTTQILESLMRKASCPHDFVKNQEAFIACDGVNAIADILAPSFPPHEIETLISSIDLISCLTLYDVKQREAVVDSSSFSWILNFIANPATNVTLLEKSLQIVYNISLEEQLLPHILNRAAIPILVARLNTNAASSLTLELVLVIIANLMIDEATRITFRKHGIAAALIRIVHVLEESKGSFENIDEMNKTIMEIVGNAACDEILRLEFNSLEAVEHFKSLVKHKSSEISDMALTAIENLNIPVAGQEASATQLEVTPVSNEEYNSPLFSNFTVREMVDSEQAFVRRINIFLRVYLDPLDKIPDSPIPKDLESSLFLNIREILGIHTDLLRELKQRFDSDKPGWSELFIDFASKESVSEAYRVYITGFESSLNILADQMAASPKIEQYLSNCDKDKECNGLNFAAFLLMPVQRICRYSLFLKEMQGTVATKHSEDFTKAITDLQELEQKLNGYQKEAQEHAKLALIKKSLVGISKAFLLEAQQECLYDGLVVEYLPQGSRHVQIFLFSDIMIICCFQVQMGRRKNKKKLATTESKIKMHMDNVVELTNLEVIELPPDKATGQHMLKLKWSEGESILYMTDSEMKQWVSAIAKAKLK